MIKLFRSAVLAGITIGVAGFGYLASGVQGEVYGTLVGAVLFCFGLLTVLGYRLALYTGTAGFIFTRLSPMDLQTPAQAVLQGRLNTGALRCGILAIGCGFIMTTTVNFARKGNVLPLLFGVPLFIVCGFPHCMADAFLYMTAPFSFLKANVLSILPMYICIVIGNFVGCNLYRIVLEKSQYSA